MSPDPVINPEAQIKLLRDQIARLISRNLELQRQLDDLKRDRADLAIDEIAAAAVRSVRSAELALAEETGEGRRYTVSQLQTTLRGFLVQPGDRLALRLPLPENSVPPDHLGSLQMTFSQVPTAPPPDAEEALVATLEDAQAAFANWHREPGAAHARDVTARLTHLLSIRRQWGQESFVRAVHALADGALGFAHALGQGEIPRTLQRYQAAAQRVSDVAKSLLEARRAVPKDMARMAAAVARLVRHYRTLLQKSTGHQ